MSDEFLSVSPAECYYTKSSGLSSEIKSSLSNELANKIDEGKAVYYEHLINCFPDLYDFFMHDCGDHGVYEKKVEMRPGVFSSYFFLAMPSVKGYLISGLTKFDRSKKCLPSEEDHFNSIPESIAPLYYRNDGFYFSTRLSRPRESIGLPLGLSDWVKASRYFANIGCGKLEEKINNEYKSSDFRVFFISEGGSVFLSDLNRSANNVFVANVNKESLEICPGAAELIKAEMKNKILSLKG